MCARSFIELTEDELKLYSEKNPDYAKGGDTFGNFNRVANILSNYPNLKLSTPEVVAIVYLLKQFDAFMWQINQGYEGLIENVDSRLRDVHVYAKLIRILHEMNKEEQPL
jgi:hypothetical protein